MAVIVSKGIAPFKGALINEPEDPIKAAACSLGQIGKHSPIMQNSSLKLMYLQDF
jgi:hypothetical protein